MSDDPRSIEGPGPSDRLFTPRFFLMCGFTFTVFLSLFQLLPTAPFRILDLGGSTAAAGLFLGVLYLKTASLWLATGAHLAWNWCTGYLADVPVSGLEILNAPLYEGVVRGPDWLGGGSFGPEGSLISTLILAGVVAWCWRTEWLRPGEAALAARPLAVLTGRVA